MMSLSGFKNLLVGLAPDPQLPSAAVDLALDLAARFDAHLTVEVDSTDDMPIGAMNYEAVAMVETVNDRFAAAAKVVCERVELMAKISGVRCTVRSSSATYLDLEHAFAMLARSHDVAVLDAGDIGSRYVTRALFDSGRPVIVVPASNASRALRHAIVAWDGSAGAARAVNDAIPLLQAMDRVELVCVRSAEQLLNRLPGFGIAEHLRRHGVDAVLLEIPTTKGSVDKTLVEHVSASKADIVVMGAFSRWRLQERIFGGTTHSMLEQCPTTLLLSHR